MPDAAPSQRVAYIHAGTHKTGTTSIQRLLAANEPLLRDAGVFLPNAGRVDPASAGHHNIAWELGRDQRYRHDHGSFSDALREIAAADAPVVCLTSEDFELMHADAAALRALRDGLAGVGYQVRTILYVRPQADYLESLYATIVQEWNVDFSTFLDNILEGGIHGSSCFDYDRLANAMSAVFGRRNLIVRAYQSRAPADALLREFIATLSRDIAFESLVRPPKLNNRVSFARVLAARSAQIGYDLPANLNDAHGFEPLTLLDLIRLTLRFSVANQRLQQRYGTPVRAASHEILTRELITELFGDRKARQRKRLLRMLTGNRDDAVAAA